MSFERCAIFFTPVAMELPSKTPHRGGRGPQHSPMETGEALTGLKTTRLKASQVDKGMRICCHPGPKLKKLKKTAITFRECKLNKYIQASLTLLPYRQPRECKYATKKTQPTGHTRQHPSFERGESKWGKAKERA